MSLPPLIQRSVLFGNPDHASPLISPDGQYLTWVAPADGVLNLWMAPRDNPLSARVLTHDRDRGIRNYALCHDDRHLVYLQDAGGNENWQVFLLDYTDPLSKAQPITSADGQARLLGHNRWHPTTVLIGLNDRDPQLHDIWQLDLTTGSFEMVHENPGYAEWLIDTDLQVRGGATMAEDGSVTIHLERHGDRQPYLHIPADDAATTGVVGFTRSGAMLLLSSLDANATRLERHDLSNGERQVLYSDDTFDVSGVWQNPHTCEVQVIEVLRDRQELVILDAALQPHIAALQTLGTGELGVNRRERSDRWWIVALSPSDGPIGYWIYDAHTESAQYLFPHRADLVGQSLAPMEPFVYAASDELPIHGYLTFPPGVSRTSLPAVLLVHGGPWHRDEWGFDPQAQWLANRGYVCVQVNFRGSTGYGKDFVNAGDQQWGRAMHTDLLDAVDYVVQQGWVDRQRIGIMGGSYGGYAVLAAAAFTPKVFRCGVDIVGPSSLLTLLASVPEYWKPVLAMMYRRVGNPETQVDLLRAASPLYHVDAIEMPLLVVQGANDPRVKQAEAEQIVQALAAKGLPHEYLLYPDEGHGLAKPDNRETMFAAAEAFLAQHLGGRLQK